VKYAVGSNSKVNSLMSNKPSKANSTKWITSAGGPLILLDERSLERWGGIFDPITGAAAPDGIGTDYARACEVEGYIGRIPVNSVEAIVLADEPMPTAWVSDSAGVGAFVRWMAGEDENEFLAWLPNAPTNIFAPDGRFLVHDSKLLLFDAAFAGRNVRKWSQDYLEIDLKPGDYEIMTAYWEPNDRTWMIVHQLRAVV
jgi:hypothetical protein